MNGVLLALTAALTAPSVRAADPEDVRQAVEVLEATYGDQGEVDHTDGVSVDCGSWRFNLRMSNTEPVVRLNVESRGDVALMESKTAELLALIEG